VLGLTGLNVLLSIQAVALDMEFYVSQWAELDIPRSAGMSWDDLKLVGRTLVSYFLGTQDTPQVTVTVDGTSRPVFRDNEIEHLHDVRDLFQLGFSAKRVCQVMVLLGILLAGLLPGADGHHDERRNWSFPVLRIGQIVSKSLKTAGILLLACTLLLSLPAALDFTRWWTGFHLITFDNDLWRLDPDTDWLIKMFPQEFFFAAVKRIGLFCASITAAYIALGIISGFSVRYFSSNYSKYNF
jgi:hypothetical protein